MSSTPPPPPNNDERYGALSRATNNLADTANDLLNFHAARADAYIDSLWPEYCEMTADVPHIEQETGRLLRAWQQAAHDLGIDWRALENPIATEVDARLGPPPTDYRGRSWDQAAGALISSIAFRQGLETARSHRMQSLRSAPAGIEKTMRDIAEHADVLDARADLIIGFFESEHGSSTSGRRPEALTPGSDWREKAREGRVTPETLQRGVALALNNHRADIEALAEAPIELLGRLLHKYGVDTLEGTSRGDLEPAAGETLAAQAEREYRQLESAMADVGISITERMGMETTGEGRGF